MLFHVFGTGSRYCRPRTYKEKTIICNTLCFVTHPTEGSPAREEGGILSFWGHFSCLHLILNPPTLWVACEDKSECKVCHKLKAVINWMEFRIIVIPYCVIHRQKLMPMVKCFIIMIIIVVTFIVIIITTIMITVPSFVAATVLSLILILQQERIRSPPLHVLTL